MNVSDEAVANRSGIVHDMRRAGSAYGETGNAAVEGRFRQGVAAIADARQRCGAVAGGKELSRVAHMTFDDRTGEFLDGLCDCLLASESVTVGW